MKHGDFIKIDFIGKVIATGKVFDFTQADVAKKEGIHNPEHKYEPVLVIIGAKMVIPGVEEQLMNMKVGDEKTFTVSPEKAFGPRNPRMTKVFSHTAFIQQKVNPTPGVFVQIEGMRGKVQSSSGGRVRVDFNHPLAGKELSYQVTITKEITSAKEKVDALFSYYSIPFTATVKEDNLEVTGDKEVPHEVQHFVQESVTKWIKDIKKITFTTSKN